MNHSQSPNIVVFFTDQQRWDTTGVHGNPLELTPNFDRMAQSGTHVYNSFTCQPVCGPARSCLQTGLYATQTGVYVNGPALQPDAQTLAHSISGQRDTQPAISVNGIFPMKNPFLKPNAVDTNIGLRLIFWNSNHDLMTQCCMIIKTSP